MTFGHEQLDVYRAAIEYVGWAFRIGERLKGHRTAKDQLLRLIPYGRFWIEGNHGND
ncbi:MAG: hypothetical protein P8Y80_04075 [Acidobacteriota bacterium]